MNRPGIKTKLAFAAGVLAVCILASVLVMHVGAKSSASQSRYEEEPASEFLFLRKATIAECADRKPGGNAMREQGSQVVFVGGNEAPYLITRPEKLTLSRAQAPSLAVAADLSSLITVSGSSGNNWSVNFCAQGEGQSEAEARDHLQQVSMNRVGNMLLLNGFPLSKPYHAMGSLAMNAPRDAPLVINASYAAAEVRDMAGPVWVAASDARATILDTTGQVNAKAEVVDFAGSQGRVNLTGQAEINIKMTARQFEGTLWALSQRPLRVLAPPGFRTPFEATVSRPQDFICRADMCAKMKQEKQNHLYVFTYAGEDGASVPLLHLRSEYSTVVIDNPKQK
jgi:hypothetical protein